MSLCDSDIQILEEEEEEEEVNNNETEQENQGNDVSNLDQDVEETLIDEPAERTVLSPTKEEQASEDEFPSECDKLVSQHQLELEHHQDECDTT